MSTAPGATIEAPALSIDTFRTLSDEDTWRRYLPTTRQPTKHWRGKTDMPFQVEQLLERANQAQLFERTEIWTERGNSVTGFLSRLPLLGFLDDFLTEIDPMLIGYSDGQAYELGHWRRAHTDSAKLWLSMLPLRIVLAMMLIASLAVLTGSVVSLLFTSPPGFVWFNLALAPFLMMASGAAYAVSAPNQQDLSYWWPGIIED